MEDFRNGLVEDVLRYKRLNKTSSEKTCLSFFSERHNRSASSDRLWSPFQDTANTITLLYKGEVILFY